MTCETPAEMHARLSLELESAFADPKFPAAKTVALPVSRPLFAIGADLAGFLGAVEDGGEIGPELDAWFAGIVGEEAVKLDAYVDAIRYHEARKQTAMAESARFRGYGEVSGSVVEKLKARLKQHLETTGRKRAETATGRPISLRGNGGQLPLVIDDERPATDVEPRFLKVVTTLDTELVRAALEAGEVLPFAALAPRGTHLRVG